MGTTTGQPEVEPRSFVRAPEEADFDVDYSSEESSDEGRYPSWNMPMIAQVQLMIESTLNKHEDKFL